MEFSASHLNSQRHLKQRKKNWWYLNLSFVFVLILMLMACGGGSGSASSSSHIQLLSFSRTGPVNLTVGATGANPATGKGTGSVSYNSSNTSIATVDSAGQITAVALGTAIITANIDADATYPAGTNRYTVNVVIPAPNALSDKRLTLYVNQVGVQQASAQFPDFGPITSYFHDTNYIEHGSDLGIGDPYGSYTTKVQNINQLQITEINAYDTIVTTLSFTSNTEGTFSRAYYSPDGSSVVLAHEGTFELNDMLFQIVPDDFTNRTLQLNFASVTSSLPAAESPVVGQSFNALFLANNRININPSPSVTWGASDNISHDTLFDASISGLFDTSSRTYQIHLKFDYFTQGSFTLDIDNGAAIASGNFTTTYQFPYVHNPLKGQLIEGKYFSSVNTQITYPYSIYLPPNYATSGKQYPVVYILDGQYYGTDSTDWVDNNSKDVILVSLSSISEDRRNIDFVAPGAENYIKFLKQEFIPMIESTYTTSQERTLFATSLGGSLAAILLTKEPVGTPYFKNYIVADGTFWWYTPEYLQAEQDRYNASDSMSISLFLSSCRQGQITSVLDAAKRYSDRHYKGMNIMYREYQIQHYEAAPLTFSDYMDILF